MCRKPRSIYQLFVVWSADKYLFSIIYLYFDLDVHMDMFDHCRIAVEIPIDSEVKKS